MKRRLNYFIFAILALALLVSAFAIYARFSTSITRPGPSASALAAQSTNEPAIPSARIAARLETKKAIMGTPAQLLEDMKSAGFDLTNGKYERPELLQDGKFDKENNTTSYEFANGGVDIDKSTGELISFSMMPHGKRNEAKGAISTPIPEGKLGDAVSMVKAKILDRYGRDYAYSSYGSPKEYDPEYYFYVDGDIPALWKIDFDTLLTDEGVPSYVVAWKISDDLMVVNAESKGGVLAVSGTGKVLYDDLAEMGLSLGLPSNRPEVMKIGWVPKRLKPTPVSKIKVFYNATVLLSADNVVFKFLLNKPEGLSWNGIVWSYRHTFQGLPSLPAGSLLKAYYEGRSEVEKRYGPANETRSGFLGKNDLSYYLVLDNGQDLSALYVNFNYSKDNLTKSSAVYGKVETKKVYYLQQANKKLQEGRK